MRNSSGIGFSVSKRRLTRVESWYRLSSAHKVSRQHFKASCISVVFQDIEFQQELGMEIFARRTGRHQNRSCFLRKRNFFIVRLEVYSDLRRALCSRLDGHFDNCLAMLSAD